MLERPKDFLRSWREFWTIRLSQLNTGDEHFENENIECVNRRVQARQINPLTN